MFLCAVRSVHQMFNMNHYTSSMTITHMFGFRHKELNHDSLCSSSFNSGFGSEDGVNHTLIYGWPIHNTIRNKLRCPIYNTTPLNMSRLLIDDTTPWTMSRCPIYNTTPWNKSCWPIYDTIFNICRVDPNVDYITSWIVKMSSRKHTRIRQWYAGHDGLHSDSLVWSVTSFSFGVVRC